MHIVPRANWPAGSRSFPVQVRIDNWGNAQGQPVLKEGMLARVTLQSPPRRVIKVHKDCIVRSSGKPVVFKIDKTDQRAAPIEIEPGEIVGDYVEVRRTKDPAASLTGAAAKPADPDTASTEPLAIADGDWVVSEGAERLRAFQLVKVLEAETRGAAGE